MSSIFIGAILFSIWFMILFFGKSLGLSVILFTVPLALFTLYILKRNRGEKSLKANLLILPIAILSVTYFIYNNEFFNLINILVIPILIAIMILQTIKEKFDLDLKTLKKILYVFWMPIDYLEETLKKLKEYIKSKIKITPENILKLKRIGKMLLITIPFVLVILVLLSTADAVFGNIFEEMFDIIESVLFALEIETVVQRVLLVIVIFIYLICLFNGICTVKEEYKNFKEGTIKVKDNFTIKSILACLNIIYLVFCIIQIKSLFMKQVNINYADYARKGFFQLMIVSAINLVTILIAKKSEIKEEIKSNRYIKAMCIIMIIFTFIILISAAYRMYLYESTYGYTLLRLLVYCTLFTESILLLPTIIFIIDKKINLAEKYFYIVLVIYVCMNLANFDNIIAKRNVDRYFKTGDIDIDYLIYGTGTDAIEHVIKVYKNEEIKYKEKEVEKEVKKEEDRKDKNIALEGIRGILEKNDIEYIIKDSVSWVGRDGIIIYDVVSKQVRDELLKYENVIYQEYWKNTEILEFIIIETEYTANFPAGYYIYKKDEIETELNNLEEYYDIKTYNNLFDSHAEYNFEEFYYYDRTKEHLEEMYQKLSMGFPDFRNINLSKERALKLLTEAGIKKE